MGVRDYSFLKYGYFWPPKKSLKKKIIAQQPTNQIIRQDPDIRV